MSILTKNLPNLKSLQCFLAVAQELSFRSAAQLMNISQPPLSRHIQELEHQLNIKLFERTTHYVKLTAEGEKLKEQLYPILTALENSLDSLAELKYTDMKIKLGLTNVIDFSLIPKIHDILRQNRSNKISLPHRANSQVLTEKVRKKELDLAIIGDIHPSYSELNFVELTSNPLMVALSDKHPASSLSSIKFSDIIDLPLFWFPRADNPNFYDKCNRVFEKHNYHPKKLTEPNDYAELLGLITFEEGVAFPSSTMQAASRMGVVYKKFDKKIECELSIKIHLIYRKNEKNRNILSLIQLFKKNCLCQE